MRRTLVAVLSLMLLLAGCKGGDMSETTENTTVTETTPQGIYISDSAIEQQTQGAVRAYQLESDSYSWLAAIGDKLLLASGEGNTELTLLTGDTCVPSKTALSVDLTTQEACFQATYSGFVYYSENTREAVFLDPQLQQVDKVQMPADMQGKPVFSPDGTQIFYCTEQQIRVLEVEMKISRLIKSHACASQTLLGCYFEGQILCCQTQDMDGNTDVLYLSTQTGQTLSTDSAVAALYSYENSYLAVRMDGSVRQLITGTLDGEAQQLNTGSSFVSAALELGGAVCYSVGENDDLHLDFYDLSTGCRSATIDLQGVGMPQAILADRWTGCVWLLTDGNSLLRWDIKASAVAEDAVYTGPVFTAEAPDEAGLESCDARVSQMNSDYGVRIRIWKTAVKYPGEYALEPEYQTQAINSVLDELEAVLQEFPKKFLYKSVNSLIRICIVRSVDAEVKAVQYWDDGDAFVILSVGVDVRDSIMKALGYIVDSHVLGNSAKYDYWNDLNPEGFVYGQEQSQDYLTGESRAFVDAASMESSTEDRSRIFWQAMCADNAQMFQSEIMQNKLLLICQAIRDAWNLEQKTDVYPWEQYLNQSIAYVES